MVAGEEESEPKMRLECFDGTQPEKYRMWKRRAQLMIQALPTSISEKKHGAKLMSFISGEAEALLEHLPVEKICSEDGVQAIWTVLDERYGPQQIDLLQSTLKTFFHELSVKNGESYRQFMVRFEASKKLEELEVKLPGVVVGFLFMKKLRMESQAESMLLTTTRGKLDYKEILQAVKNVFPDGKGPSTTRSARDVFQVESKETVDEDAEEDQCALDVMVADMQNKEDYDEEELLECYESYTDVRKRMGDQKKNRGYYPKSQPDRYRITGTVKGRIEPLKARTRCHTCKQYGHWRRECPAARSSASSQSSRTTDKVKEGKEVLIVEDDHTRQLWEAFYTDVVTENVSWEEGLATDVRNVGFADTHSTGNRQRDDQDRSPVVHAEAMEDRRHELNPPRAGDLEVHVSEQFERNKCLATCGVPDTACRKTLVGSETLNRIEKCLGAQGYSVKRAKVANEFKFGNSGTLCSHEVAMLPANVGGKQIVVKAAVLPGKGQETPLLLSKEFMRQLGSVMDMGSDEVFFKRMGVRLKMKETLRGHYALPLFVFDAAAVDCFVVSEKKSKNFDIDSLEQVVCGSRQKSVNQIPGTRDSESHGVCKESRDQQFSELSTDSRDRNDVRAASTCSTQEQGQGSVLGRESGSCRRLSGTSHFRTSCDRSREVCMQEVDAHAGVHEGQELCVVGQGQCERELSTWSRDEAVPGVCGHGGSQEASTHSWRGRGADGCLSADAEDFGSDATSLESKGSGNKTKGEGENLSSHRPRRHGVGRSGSDSGQRGSQSEVERDGIEPCGERQTEEGIASPEDGSASSGTSLVDDESSRLNSEATGEKTLSRKARKTLHRNIQFLRAVDETSGHQCDLEKDLQQDVLHVELGGHDVSEVFSVPRLCPVAHEKGLRAGHSYDIDGGWDILKADHRKQCLEEIRNSKPRHVHVSVPCGPFSPLQRLSANRGDSAEKRRKRIEAEVLLRFGIQVCQLQMNEGRDFSFEHPKEADSWYYEELDRLKRDNRVMEVVFDQCAFGLKDPVSNKLYKKGTRIITTNPYMERLLGKRCSGDHDHERLEGQVKVGGRWTNRTRCAQVYPRKMVEAMAKAIRFRRDEQMRKTISDVFAVEALSEKKESLLESIRRCHNNLGHPSTERFLHLLKSAGASSEAIQVAKGFKCSVCISQRPPVTHPVVKTKRAHGFNQQVCLDTFDVTIYDQKKLKFFNIIDEGTGLQMCVPLWRGAKSREVRKAYRKHWVRWAGCPVRALVDGGSEFEGEMMEGLDRDNTYVTVTAAGSPWQNGLAERNGGLWKQIFRKAFEECQPRCKTELNELCDKVCESKNSMVRKHGFSPYQHVFGCDLRIPHSLLDEGTSMTWKHGILVGTENHTRAQEIRQAARRALIAMDDEENVKKAVQRQSRPARREFQAGDFVYYWRREQEKTGVWKGPGRVIGFFESKSRIWVAHGNKVLRCSPSQLRHLTQEQLEAATMVTSDLVHLPVGAKRGAQVFTDITRDGEPPDTGTMEEETGHGTTKRRRLTEQTDITMNDEGQNEDETSPEVEVEMGTEPTAPTTTPTPTEENESDHPDTDVNETGENAVMTDEERKNDADPGTTSGRARVSPYPLQRPDQPPDTAVRSSYGPVRGDLEAALRRSVDILDHGMTRVPRSELAPCPETYDESDEVLMVESKKEIYDKDMTVEEKKALGQAKTKEWNKLINTGSIIVHKGKDAEKIRATIPMDRFLDSRFVKTRRENPDQPGCSEVKCRWCIQGYKDPDVLDVERQSPTLSMEALSVVLQVIVSQGWRLIISDVEGAFLQGEPLKREKGRLFVKIPKEGVPGCDVEDVVEVVKCVYGLVDAPRKWWLSFSNTLRSLGMKQSELDPCVFYWYHEQQLQGCLAFHVDDMVIGGSSLFHEVVLSKLKQKYPFKHWKIGGGMFLGKQLKQREDFSIVCDQKEYANQVQTIKLSKDRRKQKEQPVTESERKKLRGVVGAGNWLMGNTRPDIAVSVAFLQQRIQKANVSDLIEANKLVAKIRDFSHIQIIIKPIPLMSGAILVASDASWANTEDLRSQAGYMVLFTHEKIQHGHTVPVTPLRWKTYKQDRHTQSTLGAELISLSRAVAEAEWIRSLLAEAINSEYVLSRDKEFREQIPMTVTIDNKPIFDHTCGDGITVKDKRMAIEMLIIRRDIRENNIKLRWVETKQMIVDCLTKLSASADFLLRVLREGVYSVCLMIPEKNQVEVSPTCKKGGEKSSHSTVGDT